MDELFDGDINTRLWPGSNRENITIELKPADTEYSDKDYKVEGLFRLDGRVK